jgi:septal ring factor EnvC (AmiA/AmiB activator)
MGGRAAQNPEIEAQQAEIKSLTTKIAKTAAPRAAITQKQAEIAATDTRIEALESAQAAQQAEVERRKAQFTDIGGLEPPLHALTSQVQMLIAGTEAGKPDEVVGN